MHVWQENNWVNKERKKVKHPRPTHTRRIVKKVTTQKFYLLLSLFYVLIADWLGITEWEKNKVWIIDCPVVLWIITSFVYWASWLSYDYCEKELKLCVVRSLNHNKKSKVIVVAKQENSRNNVDKWRAVLVATLNWGSTSRWV